MDLFLLPLPLELVLKNVGLALLAPFREGGSPFTMTDLMHEIVSLVLPTIICVCIWGQLVRIITYLPLAASCFANPFCKASISESRLEEEELLLDCVALLLGFAAGALVGGAVFSTRILVAALAASVNRFGLLKIPIVSGNLYASRVDSYGFVR